MESKKETVEDIFFNYHSKKWHFKELKEKIGIADNKLSRWLKILEEEKIIKKIKEKGKHPYYTSTFPKEEFKNAKKLYFINQIHKFGLVDFISKNKDIETAIIFGSMSRADWHFKSDLDLFFLGNGKTFDENKFEKKFGREFQIFSYENVNFSKKINKELLKNIANGFVIKGNVVDLFEKDKIKGL